MHMVAIGHADVGGRLVAADARAVEEEVQIHHGHALARRERIEEPL